MKILLTAINAKYIHSNLAVYSLKASAGKYEPMIELAEYTINHQLDDIFRSIYQKKPDLLFFSCYIWNRREILELAADIRRVLPDTVIWLGGPEVSYDAMEVLNENPQIDGIMIGEGEVTFKKLLAYYVDFEGSLVTMRGIAFRGNPSEESERQIFEPILGKKGAWERNAAQKIRNICQNQADAPMEWLDELPFVYNNIEDFQNRIIYYESSRGCPFSCSYCLSSIDKRVRFRSLELVKKELAFFLEHKVPQVKFVDRTFNCSHVHAQEIWKFIQEHDNHVTNFHFEIAADLLNEEEIELLSKMRPGLVQLEIGVQTVNERTLEAICRTAKFEKITERVRQIAAFGNIHQHLDLIAGLPYEDYESFKTSFDAVYSLRPQELQLGFLKVLKGSEMHRRREEYGIIYRSSQPYEVLATKWISCDELLRLKEVEEMLEVHYNSQQFRNTILALECYFARPFDLYAALADYYKEEKLWGRSYSRQQRFEILRSFIQKTLREFMQNEQTGINMHIAEQMPEADKRKAEMQRFDELLTLDFYLRENAKSRPQWAANQDAYRSQIIAFYQQEEQERRILPLYEGMTWKQMMRMTHVERFEYVLPQAAGTDGTGAGRIDHVQPDKNGNAVGHEMETVSGCKTVNGCWILFDYEKRNPLTYDAEIIAVDIQQDGVFGKQHG